MLVCPRCCSRYSVEVDRCGIDGERLIETDTDPLLGRPVDRYVIEERLGAGAMGCVYRARHEKLDRVYAIKVLFGQMAADKRIARRFEREATSLSKMNHPNIVEVYDFGTTSEGLTFLAMEHIEGRTLGSIMGQVRPFPLDRARDLCRQIALGLQAAHAQGFLHRDLKPGNVMVRSEGHGEQVKILDFGLVAVTDPGAGDTKLTHTRETFGTPRYMAPEQIDGDETGPAADLYALGSILFEMIAGRPVFEADRLMALLLKKTSKPPPPTPPAGGLEHLVDQLIRTDPAERPGSATEVIEALDRFGAACGAQTIPGAGVSTDDSWIPTDTLPSAHRSDVAAKTVPRPQSEREAAPVHDAEDDAEAAMSMPLGAADTAPGSASIMLQAPRRYGLWGLGAALCAVALVAGVQWSAQRRNKAPLRIAPLQEAALPSIDEPVQTAPEEAPAAVPVVVPTSDAGVRPAPTPRPTPTVDRRRSTKKPQSSAFQRVEDKVTRIEAGLRDAGRSLGADQRRELQERLLELSMGVVEGLSAKEYAQIGAKLDRLNADLRTAQAATSK